tara:strand:- start:6331 stop:7779 length:1449 start_codon:yes stop_codon:yes gene_type:complete
MSSLTGLQSGNFTDIDVVYSIGLNGDQGSNNQVIKSDGENSSWSDVSGLISFEELSADGSTITIGGSTAGDYDTTVAKTIAVAKVPNALTAGTNINFNTGTTYDGSGAITISATDTNTQLNLTADLPMEIDSSAGGLNKNVELNFDSNTMGAGGGALEVLKVPNALTKGTNINFSAGTTYDGSGAITISATDTDTTYQGSSTIDINTGTTPDTISTLKVPNTLNVGSNVSMVLTADGSSVSSYDGSAGVSISATANTNTQLNLTGGDGITITDTGGLNRTITVDADGTTLSVSGGQAGVIKVPNNLTAGDGVSFFNTDDGATATTYSGVNPITMSVLPPDVFEVSGAKRMTINLSNFMPDDDSSFYNIAVEDDLSTKIHGSIKVMNSALEVCGYFVIPNGFGATACRIDITNSSGVAVSRTLTFEEFTTYGATGFSSLGTGTSNSEQSFSSTLTGASDKLLLIRINTTSTSDHIRGGYIRLV